MNDKFLLMIQAALDSKGIKSDYNELKKWLNKDPVKVNAIMDMSATKTEVNKFIKEFAPELQKMFKNIGVSVDVKDIETSMKSVFNESQKAAKQFQKDIEQAYKLNESYNQKQIASQKKLYIDEQEAYKTNQSLIEKEANSKRQLFLDEEQAYKTNESLRQKAITDEKKLYTDTEQAYKTNNSINQKKISDMNKLNQATIEAYKTNEKFNNSVEISKTRAEGANKSFSAYLKTLKPQALTKYSTEIRKISDAFTAASTSGKSIDLSKANSQLSNFKSEMKNAGMETASFTQTLKENIGAFGQWYAIGNAISFVVRSFRNAIGNIKEVDTQLTEISKTSNLVGDDLKQLGIDAYDAASKYGNTVQSYLSGFLEMSRGTDTETAKRLAELSILAQSAGDMTAKLANEYIIATNAAYKLNNETSKLNEILDGQNQITNRNQVSMSDLAESTKVAGSQAAASGIEVNEMTAALGTMIASTKQGGEVAGRAFKGILMNLQQVSGEIDGEVFNEESFKKVEKTLNDVGVSVEEIVDGTARLRDPIEILKELAKVYNSLPSDSVDKANIISDLGGKVYHVIQKCITRIYLIAGNTLEPYTTI